MNKLLLVLCLALFACDQQERVNELTYTKDKRTGLCFATYSLGMNTGAMSNVPCTPEVEKLIVK